MYRWIYCMLNLNESDEVFSLFLVKIENKKHFDIVFAR